MQFTSRPKEDTMSRSTRFAALLVVVAAAVLAPLSQAMTVITDNSPSQNRLAQSTNNPYAKAITVFESKEHAAVSQNPVSFTTENASSQNRVSLLNAAENAVRTSSPNTFDWGDAGIGAGTVGGILLLVAAGMLATVRRSEGRRLAV
jgi:hypothetical protein